ncbi:MAG: hypothetical protein WDN46_23515 [Methylocella sp.]
MPRDASSRCFRRNGTDQNVTGDPSRDGGHKGEHEDAEHVEAPLDANNGAAQREDHSANPIKAIDQETA